jgi:hypothetical protein
MWNKDPIFLFFYFRNPGVFGEDGLQGELRQTARPAFDVDPQTGHRPSRHRGQSWEVGRIHRQVRHVQTGTDRPKDR